MTSSGLPLRSAAQKLAAYKAQGQDELTKRKKKHGVHPAANAHAGKGAGAFRQKSHDGERGEAAQMRDDVAGGCGHAHAEEIGHGAAVPAPGGEGAAVKQTVARRQQKIARKAEHGAGKRRPGDARRAAGRKREAAEPEAEIADEIGDGHDDQREQREEYLLVGPENGIHHDEHVVEGKLAAIGGEKRGERRAQGFGNAHDPEDCRLEKHGRRGHNRAHGGGKHDDEPRVSVGPRGEARAE